MKNNCWTIPKVRNVKTNEVSGSKLFNDLLSLTNFSHQNALDIYSRIKHEDFDEKFGDLLQYDEFNEPTLASLMKRFDFSDILNKDDIINYLNQQIGYYDRASSKFKSVKYSTQSFNEAIDKAIKFNKSSEYRERYVAQVRLSKNDEGDLVVYVEVNARNESNSADAKDMQMYRNLNLQLMDILRTHGIGISLLEDFEDNQGFEGRVDFNLARKFAGELILMIKISNNEEGEKTLSEEFSHVAIRAMKNDLIVLRLLNYIDTNNLVETILGNEYQHYVEAYNNRNDILVEEAAGKLLLQQLINKQKPTYGINKNLILRFVDHVKNFFRRITKQEVINAISTAEKYASEIATDILTNNSLGHFEVEELYDEQSMYRLSTKIKNEKQALQYILENELRKYNVYSKRKGNEKWLNEQKIVIYQLESLYDTNKFVQGIYDYLEYEMEHLKILQKDFDKMRESFTKENDEVQLKKMAQHIRQIKMYIDSFANVNEMLANLFSADKRQFTPEYRKFTDKAMDDLALMQGIITMKLIPAYIDMIKPIAVEFLSLFCGDGVKVSFGKYRTKDASGNTIKVSLEDILERADHDISWADRLLDSMANSSDDALKILDQAIKSTRKEAKDYWKTVCDEIISAALQAEKSGITDFSFMYERYKDGTRTGYYISPVNYGEYVKAQREFYELLDKKYGENPSNNADILKKKNEIAKWLALNTVWVEQGDGVKIRQPAQGGIVEKGAFQGMERNDYTSDVYREITKTPNDPRYIFAEKILDIKYEMDSYLPTDAITPGLTIKIRKDLFEKIKSSSSLKEGASEFFEAMKDQVVRRSDDVDFGVRLGVDGEALKSLPLYYINIKEGETEEDMSMDIVSTLQAYSLMALDYKAMNNVIDELELSKDVIMHRDIPSGKRESKLSRDSLFALNFIMLNESNSNRKLDRMFDMHVYGRYIDDEGTFGNTRIDKAKAANLANRLTALNQYAFNLLAGISNVATGEVMMRIEGFAGQFFTNKEIHQADAEYRRLMPEYLKLIGDRYKTNKLSLFDEEFDVLLDYDKNAANLNWDRKGLMKRMFEESSLYFMNDSGEHWMQNRTAIACAIHYKMLDENGYETNLWEALEVRYRREDGTYDKDEDHGLGARLFIKDGYTKPNGDQFILRSGTVEQFNKDKTYNEGDVVKYKQSLYKIVNGENYQQTENDKIIEIKGKNSTYIARKVVDDGFKFTRRVAGINHRLHGIYNKQDQVILQTLSYGRMIMMYRKYLKPAWDRRFAFSEYDQDLDIETEGYYVTYWQYLKDVYQEMKELNGILSIILASKIVKDSYTETQLANIVRALTEMLYYLSIQLSILGFNLWKPNDDEHKKRRKSKFISYALSLIEYELRRLNTEIGAMTPSYSLAFEPFKLLKNPAAAVTTAQDAIRTLGLLNPLNYMDDSRLKQGRYKGRTKAYKLFWESPFIPLHKPIYRALHPDTSTRWLKTEFSN